MPSLVFSTVLALQEVDLRLDALVEEQAQIEAALRDKSEIETVRQALERHERTWGKHAAAQRDAELTLETLTDEIQRKNKLLWSGELKNPRELQDLQADLNNLMERRVVLEEAALQAMVAADEAREVRDAHQQRLHALQEDFAEKEQTYQARQKVLAKEIPACKAERASVAAEVDRALLSLYESLRNRLRGRVLVTVARGQCTHCNINLPDSLLRRAQQATETVYCDNCGRMLYLPR